MPTQFIPTPAARSGPFTAEPMSAHTSNISPKVWAIHSTIAQNEAEAYLGDLVAHIDGEFPVMRARLHRRNAELEARFARVAQYERVARAKFRPGLLADLAVFYAKFAISQNGELGRKLSAIRAQERAREKLVAATEQARFAPVPVS